MTAEVQPTASEIAGRANGIRAETSDVLGQLSPFLPELSNVRSSQQPSFPVRKADIVSSLTVMWTIPAFLTTVT
jgi:hypothetical protein